MGAGASVDDATVQRVEGAFMSTDKNENGSLNYKELINAIKGSGLNRNNSAVEAKDFMKKADADHSGSLSLDEFKIFFQKTLAEAGPEEAEKLLVWFERPAEGAAPAAAAPAAVAQIDGAMLARVEAAFVRADVNKNDAVNYKELMASIAHTGLGRMNCAAEAKDFMGKADTNRDGNLSLVEFKKFFTMTYAEAGAEEAEKVLTVFEWRAESSALQRNAADKWEPPANLAAADVSRARAIFSNLDGNADASLTARELGRALTTVGMDRAGAAKEGRRLMAAMDVDSDREITLIEFGAYLGETKGSGGPDGDRRLEDLLCFFEKMAAAPAALRHAAQDDAVGTASAPLEGGFGGAKPGNGTSLSAAQAAAGAQAAAAARGAPGVAALEAALLALKAGVAPGSAGADKLRDWVAGTPLGGWTGVKVADAAEGGAVVVVGVDLGQAEGSYALDGDSPVLALLTPQLRTWKLPQMAASGCLDAFAGCAELRELHATGAALVGDVGALGHGCPQLARLKVREAPLLGGDAGDLVSCLRLNTLWLEGSGVSCSCGEGALKQELPKCDISM